MRDQSVDRPKLPIKKFPPSELSLFAVGAFFTLYCGVSHFLLSQVTVLSRRPWPVPSLPLRAVLAAAFWWI
jgi:hypothetical protein